MHIIYNSIINKLKENNFLIDGITVSKPTDKVIKSDLFTNAAFINAKYLKKNPIYIAKDIVEIIKDINIIKNIEILKNGFINININDDIWIDSINTLISQGVKFHYNESKNKKILIEYLSANPTGPLTIGHARNAIIGTVISNLSQRAGYEVIKEYYVNDSGKQIDILGQSVISAYHNDESAQYKADYIYEVLEEVKNIDIDSIKSNDFRKVGEIACKIILKGIKKDLESFNIKFDSFVFESDIIKYKEEVFNILSCKGVTYKGILPKPIDSNEDWEQKEVLIFKSSEFGDDIDRALEDSEGRSTYFGNDILYHYQKAIQHKPDIMMNILGVDHFGYKKRIEAAMKVIDSNIDFNVIFFNIVNLIVDGESKKMSKRKGIFKTMREVVDNSNLDILIFDIISFTNNKVINFDMNSARKKSIDSKCFYLKYAYQRCCSIVDNAISLFDDFEKYSIDIKYLDDNYMSLIKMILDWNNIINLSFKTMDIVTISTYAIDLSKEIHDKFEYNTKDDRIINPYDKMKSINKAKVMLAARNTLKDIMNCINIDCNL